MDILPGFKLCRKGLHQYPIGKRQCPFCLNIAKRQWDKNNKNFCRKAVKEWRKANREYSREYASNWSKLNRGKRNEIRARYKAAKGNSIPSWVNLKKVKEIYLEAARLTKETGIKHHVDHIYPLQSKYMCGLHVETNLQILTESENTAKGNRTWPGQLDYQKD